MEEVKAQKLEAFKVKLEEEKKLFEVEKKEKLEAIAEKLKAMGVEDTSDLTRALKKAGVGKVHASTFKFIKEKLD